MSVFNETYNEYEDMWIAVWFWSSIFIIIAYVLAGFFAATKFRHVALLVFLAPMVSCLVGLCVGALCGMLLSAILCTIYYVADLEMQYWEAILWGAFLGFSYLFISVCRFISVV